jgi:hypothetical protein
MKTIVLVLVAIASFTLLGCEEKAPDKPAAPASSAASSAKPAGSGW